MYILSYSIVQNSTYGRSSHRCKGAACHIIVKSYTLHYGNPSIHLVRMLGTNLGFHYGWRIRNKSIDGTVFRYKGAEKKGGGGVE